MKGSGEQCGNKKCIEFSEAEDSRCLQRDWPEECKLYEPLKAQTEPVAEVPCSVGLDALVELAIEFEKEGGFLSNPDDHETDRACGKVYQECAERIRKALREMGI